MAKRTTKTAKKTTKSVKKRKTATRKTPRKKTTTRKSTPSRTRRVAKNVDTAEAVAVNRHALWNTYRDLQSRVDRALDKLRMHFNSRAMPHVLLEDKKELLFLLGECNYMARTCEELDASEGHSR